MELRARLVRSVRFFALHHLRRPDWDDAKNEAAFGPVADKQGHGHDYVCTVEVSGPTEHGMVMDLGALDALLQTVVVGPLAGRHLNVDVPEFGKDGVPPTCEGIAEYVYRRLLPRLPAMLTLEAVRIAEDGLLAGEVRPA